MLYSMLFDCKIGLDEQASVYIHAISTQLNLFVKILRYQHNSRLFKYLFLSIPKHFSLISNPFLITNELETKLSIIIFQDRPIIDAE